MFGNMKYIMNKAKAHGPDRLQIQYSVQYSRVLSLRLTRNVIKGSLHHVAAFPAKILGLKISPCLSSCYDALCLLVNGIEVYYLLLLLSRSDRTGSNYAKTSFSSFYYLFRVGNFVILPLFYTEIQEFHQWTDVSIY